MNYLRLMNLFSNYKILLMDSHLVLKLNQYNDQLNLNLMLHCQLCFWLLMMNLNKIYLHNELFLMQNFHNMQRMAIYLNQSFEIQIFQYQCRYIFHRLHLLWCHYIIGYYIVMLLIYHMLF